MAVLITGNSFTTADQVTAATLNAATNSATFASGAVDGSTTQLSSGAIIVKDGGVGSSKLASSLVLVTPNLGTPSAGVLTNCTGTAAGLTAGAVTINANLTGDVTSVGNATSIASGVIVNADINASAAIVDTKLDTIATALKVSNSATTAASANTASAIVARDASGNFSAGTITATLTGNASGSSGSTTGNAATATALATARAINGTNFDGTAAITVTAAAGTLSGATLASGVTASSLTSVGTLTSLGVGTVTSSGNITAASGLIACGTTSAIDPTSGSTDGITLATTGLLSLSASAAGCLTARRRTSDGNLMVFFRDTTSVGSIQVAASSTAYNTTSDVRLKENIRDVFDSGEVVDALQPRVFDWKSGANPDSYGFVAQETYPIFPQAVCKGDDGDEIVQQWQMDAAKMMPIVIAELQQLRRRVAELEA